MFLSQDCEQKRTGNYFYLEDWNGPRVYFETTQRSQGSSRMKLTSVGKTVENNRQVT